MWADLFVVTFGILAVVMPLMMFVNRTAQTGAKHSEWVARSCGLLLIATWGMVFLIYLSRWVGAFTWLTDSAS